jgi:hypothetical protein
MKNTEKQIMKRIGIDFDGWVVEAADGVISPFKHDNDVETTVKFFGFGKRTKAEAAPADGRAQPA